jgi:hypothetical protein
MKNRNLDHKDDWATPKEFYDKLNARYNFDFDPCPYMHDISKWDGLEIEWGDRNFVNPPYNAKDKAAFVIWGIEQSNNGKLCVMVLPVSTSTKLFHEHILPNKTSIEFIERRLKFMGVNSKGQNVNFPKEEWTNEQILYNDKLIPLYVSNSGMHDSMVVVFDGRK